MGVTHLWDLLAPCGRRTSVDALVRKRLAVDASIWLIQFIKAHTQPRFAYAQAVNHSPLAGDARRER